MRRQTETRDSIEPALTEAFEAAGASTRPVDFLQAIAGDYRPEELPGVDIADLGWRAAELWAFAAAAEGPWPQIQVIPATARDGRPLGAHLLEIVQPDAPFLVDSVMGELVDAHVDVLAMFHPLVEAAAGRRSAIQVWLAPLPDERIPALTAALQSTLSDARLAVEDFEAMVAVMGRAIEELRSANAVCDPADLAEDLAFLEWLDAGRFVFLGARLYAYPRTPDGGYAAEEPTFDPAQSLGVLRDPARFVLRRESEPAVLSAELRADLAAAPPLVVAKSNLKSKVHRRVYMDYVGVRRYGADGRPVGEVRFVGLFTAHAYDEPVGRVPLVRRKVEHVMARASLPEGGHNATRLANILETYPRDELFQLREDEILRIALGVLHLSDRPRVKLFARRDPFDRFVSVLFYAPRDRYDATLRARVGRMLAEAYDGRVSAYYPSYSDAPLARVHYIVGVTPGRHRQPDLAALEQAIAAAARTWSDDFERAARLDLPEGEGGPVAEIWGNAFPAGYRERYDAAEALADVIAIGRLAGGAIGLRACRRASDLPGRLRVKIYQEGEAVALAQVLPIFEDMGLSALSEDGFALSPAGRGRLPIWVHEFVLEYPWPQGLEFEAVRPAFEDAFLAVWRGQAESDGFNRLVLELGVSWREAALVRALARYRQQSGLDPSAAVQQQALSDHPHVARLILELFRLRLDPASEAAPPKRAQLVGDVQARIEAALQAVPSLDADRALRRIAALAAAIQRTNFFQPGPDGAPKPYISFKVASRELADLPDPKPYREIYVASPSVEGVHLRLGPVARGGIRWSDRQDDFRTEVLGLVKAQQVKNAVIVPVGAKGGFFPERFAKGAPPEEAQAKAIAAYKTFLCGILDLTDNIDAEGRVVRPPGVVVHDGDDPYLVVAADKGTASFSDIANALAQSYGFWLGDAFASGGSSGYDHKAMGVTARGAWESVKRHFRELGKDVQGEPFTVAGIGDMSGDVFGNGMLLSRKIKLVAAFDHRHVFLDPNPDPDASFAERERLFALAGSSWDDYDRALISAGGGVYARSAKSVTLTPEARALLDLKAEVLTPDELIVAVLRAKVELLYLGGIGTYVKGAAESHLTVGDKANDLVRVNGCDLRCKVVGEGANLGFTQAGRIEYALAGGRINTDAIDNSAGVDTSDHEVNIKILTGIAERAGDLARPDRDALLASMTGEVARHVLAHNYDQTLALTLMEAESKTEVANHAQFMADLEAKGRLDRALEGLPDAAEIERRVKEGRGLTRPELAVLLAYGKIDLFHDTTASAAPDDPHFLATLLAYFPKALGGFEDQMRRHPLRREIIATVIGNDLVNRCGPTFPRRLRAAAGCDDVVLAASFEAARLILRFEDIWAKVGALDGRAPAAAQTALYLELARVLRSFTYLLARRTAKRGTAVEPLTHAYQPAVDRLKGLMPETLSAFAQKEAVRRAAEWIKAGAPKGLAHSLVLYRYLEAGLALADLASDLDWPVEAVARLYHAVGGAFGFDRLRAAATARMPADPYERLALRRLVEDMLAEQAALVRAIMTYAGRPQAGETSEGVKDVIASWSALNAEAVKLARSTIASIERDGRGWSFPKLTIANAALRQLA
ncbi:MAG: NAD-glutamate dehydrogenase [Caulobacteraceae bacterium]|nr:NAD-glutamate dehydrogenase [Caulobacteraceae bacterium]